MSVVLSRDANGVMRFSDAYGTSGGSSGVATVGSVNPLLTVNPTSGNVVLDFSDTPTFVSVESQNATFTGTATCGGLTVAGDASLQNFTGGNATLSGILDTGAIDANIATLGGVTANTVQVADDLIMNAGGSVNLVNPDANIKFFLTLNNNVHTYLKTTFPNNYSGSYTGVASVKDDTIYQDLYAGRFLVNGNNSGSARAMILDNDVAGNSLIDSIGTITITAPSVDTESLNVTFLNGRAVPMTFSGSVPVVGNGDVAVVLPSAYANVGAYTPIVCPAGHFSGTVWVTKTDAQTITISTDNNSDTGKVAHWFTTGTPP